MPRISDTRARSTARGIIPILSLLLLCSCGNGAGSRHAASADTTRGGAVATRTLRVCADPNNLPFSNRRLEGFENRIAQMLAGEMHATVSYTWWAQRRGFVRNTLNACDCDVIIGVPSSFELAMATRPYYRSTYVFLTRKDRGLKITSLDDPRLKTLKVGVQMVGDDYATTPPALALAHRGAINNVVGYTVYGDYSTENPPARIVDAVVSGDVDVAVVWGPLAGYFARRQSVPLEITPVSPQIDPPYLPFVYDISMAVRRRDTALYARLESIIERRQGTIDSILDAYGVPRVGGVSDMTASYHGGGNEHSGM